MQHLALALQAPNSLADNALRMAEACTSVQPEAQRYKVASAVRLARHKPEANIQRWTLMHQNPLHVCPALCAGQGAAQLHAQVRSFHLDIQCKLA